MRLAKAYTAQPAAIKLWPAGSRGYRHFSLLGERGQGAERAVELSRRCWSGAFGWWCR